ncbi:MAG: ABC transporter substrate-binding protein, partial [Actinomycetota bacterium]
MTPRSKRTTLGKLLTLLLAFSLFAAACGGGDDDDSADADDADNTTTETTDGDDAGDDDGDEDEGEQVAPTIDEPVEEETDEGPVFGGTLRVTTEAESDGLNPVANNFAVSAYLMAGPVFDPLFAYDATGAWIPYLAESAAPVEGTNSWQIKLREGVLFHDGTEMTADDAIAAFEAAASDPIISLAILPSYPAENRVEKIDEYTVQYNLIRQTAHFPVNLTGQLGFVPPASYIAAAAEDPSLDQEPIGQGPFRITNRQQDSSTLVEKFEDYWQGTDNIYLDAIEFLPITDTAIAAERVAAGYIDVIITSNPDAILTLRDADSVNTIENLLSGENDIMMNTAVPPFDDI